MAEDTRRQIPIEDGNEEKSAEEKASSDKAFEEKAAEDNNASAGTAAETPETEDPSEDAGTADETAGAESDDNAGAGNDEKDEKAAEEQESERYMRLMAEFQNFKRRAAREKSDIHAYANEKIVGELLPVLDNFERAIETRSDDFEGYAKGMELIFQQLRTALEHAGLTEITALGEDFDPNVHNAVMTEQSEEHEDGKVSKVLQKGYKLNDKVIRPSMVAVVRN